MLSTVAVERIGAPRCSLRHSARDVRGRINSLGSRDELRALFSPLIRLREFVCFFLQKWVTTTPAWIFVVEQICFVFSLFSDCICNIIRNLRLINAISEYPKLLQYIHQADNQFISWYKQYITGEADHVGLTRARARVHSSGETWPSTRSGAVPPPPVYISL